MQITEREFGRTAAGEPVSCWTITNERGMTADILSYGGILQRLTLPVRGKLRDVVLGFDTVAGYEAQDCYIGALVGRVANRIGGGRFSLDDKTYSLPINSGPNCLHGGIHGWNQKLWRGTITSKGLSLRLVSPAGEEGFPATVTAEVCYRLDEENTLTLDYHATADGKTPLNLTNHSYWNLAGGGSIEEHWVEILADAITEADADMTPTGRRLPVAGTALDLRDGRSIREGLTLSHPQLVLAGGYDQNYILADQPVSPLRRVAAAWMEELRLDCYTTQPGVQLYTGNYLTGMVGKGGQRYTPRTGLCLETQNWPDAVNHPDFPSPVVSPEQPYHQITAYRLTEQSIG